MSNVSRIFKIAGDIGGQAVVNLRGSQVKGLTDGELVTIVDFATRFEGRTAGVGVPPGLWRNYAWAEVRNSRGIVQYIHTSDLQPLPEHDVVHLPRVLVRELPDTQFWEDDIVEVFDGRRGCVSFIDFDALERPVGDQPVYHVRMVGRQSNERFHARALDLVERGDVWRFYHGEPLEFGSAADEASFHHRISHVTSVANVAHDTMAFSWDQAVEALRTGDADMIWHNWAVPSADPGYSVNCYTIDDPEVGERCRLEFLELLDTTSTPAY
jgi:hypothetical protein